MLPKITNLRSGFSLLKKRRRGNSSDFRRISSRTTSPSRFSRIVHRPPRRSKRSQRAYARDSCSGMNEPDGGEIDSVPGNVPGDQIETFDCRVGAYQKIRQNHFGDTLILLIA